jgi:hypothetical protein
VKLSGSTKMYDSFRVSVASSMPVHPEVSGTVKCVCNGISYFLVLVSYLILFSVGTVDELLVLLRMPMLLISVVRRIVLGLRCLQQTPYTNI